MKKSNLITTSIFCIFIFGFFIFNIVSPDKKFSELENRNLQKFPELSFEALFSGELSSDLDTYITDQFVLRDTFVEMKSNTEKALGKKENNGVYISTENTLIDKFGIPDYENIDKNISSINKFSEIVDIPVYVTIIPTQNDILSSILPKNAPINSQKEMIDYVSDKTDNFINVYDSLLAHKDEYIFYNTDHHFTSLGAFYTYEEIAKSLGKTPVKLEDYEKTTVTNEFNGTIFSKSGVRYVKPDSIDTYVENKDILIEDGLGVRTAKMYDETFLETKDKYSMFLGGNHPVVTIKGEGEGNLLVIKDSYSNALAPFLSENYENVHIVDLRFMKLPMSEYIVINNITEVLVCYSAPNFESDVNMTFLK